MRERLAGLPLEEELVLAATATMAWEAARRRADARRDGQPGGERFWGEVARLLGECRK